MKKPTLRKSANFYGLEGFEDSPGILMTAYWDFNVPFRDFKSFESGWGVVLR